MRGRLTREEVHRLVEAIEAGPPPRALRAQALLLAHWGGTPATIAAHTGVDEATLARWTGLYAAGGLARLVGVRRRERKDAAARVARVRAALETLGADPASASVREVAALAGLPTTTTYRLLREIAPLRPSGPDPDPPAAPGLVVLGCGGAGARILPHVRAHGVTTVALDTDKTALASIDADVKLLVGKSTLRGAGASGSPEAAAAAAEAAAPAIDRLVRGSSLVLVVAGLGAGTGSGAAPVVARIARAAGATVLAVATLPLHVERTRLPKAAAALGELRAHAHTTLALPSDPLLRFAPNLPLDQAYRVMDALAADAIQALTTGLSGATLVPLDEQDVRTLLAEGGTGGLLHGEARAGDAERLVRDALEHAFHEGDPRHARAALAQLTGGPGLALADAEAVARTLHDALPHARISWGARIDPTLRGRARITILLGNGTARALHPTNSAP